MKQELGVYYVVKQISRVGTPGVDCPFEVGKVYVSGSFIVQPYGQQLLDPLKSDIF